MLSMPETISSPCMPYSCAQVVEIISPTMMRVPLSRSAESLSRHSCGLRIETVGMENCMISQSFSAGCVMLG